MARAGSRACSRERRASPAARAKPSRARALDAARLSGRHGRDVRPAAVLGVHGLPESLAALWTCRVCATVALVGCALYAGAGMRTCVSHHVFRTRWMLWEKTAMRSGHAAAGMQLSGAPNVWCGIAHPWALCGRAGGSGAAR